MLRIIILLSMIWTIIVGGCIPNRKELIGQVTSFRYIIPTFGSNFTEIVFDDGRKVILNGLPLGAESPCIGKINSITTYGGTLGHIRCREK